MAAVDFVQRVARMRHALGMRNPDAVDRWAATQGFEEHERVLREDEVAEITPDEFFRAAVFSACTPAAEHTTRLTSDANAPLDFADGRLSLLPSLTLPVDDAIVHRGPR